MDPLIVDVIGGVSGLMLSVDTNGWNQEYSAISATVTSQFNTLIMVILPLALSIFGAFWIWRKAKGVAGLGSRRV